MTTQTLTALIQTSLRALEDKKAQNITHLTLPPHCTIADSLIIATATSERHAHTLATAALEALNKAGEKNLTLEGVPANQWVLIDAGALVVHIFLPETRTLYNLEKLWQPLEEEDDIVAEEASPETPRRQNRRRPKVS